MTGTELITLVRDLLGVNSSYARLTDAQATNYVTEGMLQLAEQAMPAALRSVISFNSGSGTSTYTLTSPHAVRVLDVVDTTNKVQLDPWDPIDLNAVTTSFTNAKPKYWSIDSVDASGNIVLKLRPTPDGTYAMTATIVVKPTAISSAEITQFPLQAQYALAHFAAWRHLLNLSEDVVDPQRRSEMKTMWDEGKALYIAMQTERNPLALRQARPAQ